LQQGDSALIGYALQNFGNIYFKTGEYTKSLAYYRSSLLYLQLTRSDEDLCASYLGMAQIFRKADARDSSQYYAKLSLAVAKEGSFTRNELSAYNFLTDYYASVQNIDSAFVYQSAAIATNDSLFNQEKAKQIQALSLEEAMRQRQVEETKIHFQNQLKFYALLGGIFCLLVAAVLLYRNNRHKQKAYNLLQKQKRETDIQKQKTEETLMELKSTQSQLIQSEKMASLGELTAGIAHEIQNPLNFVNNFSEVNKELVDELETELKNNNNEEAILIAKDIRENEEKINHHGKRADAIVKNMLQHSRQTKGVKEPTDINALADEYLRLSYHGMRAKDKTFNAEMKTDFDNSIGKINIIPQDIGRVLLNLYNNAFYAVNEKAKQQTAAYEPRISVSTKKIDNMVILTVKDNGNGIPQKVVDKIFQPFFTTKPTGEGTGLGLSLSYDIVKAHGGELSVQTKESEGATFIIQLPLT
jgi:two-component system, NtrC family, sensor kinase